jgi:hypothetical protein
MGQCLTRVERAETSLNVLLGMPEAEARARAASWPDVTYVKTQNDKTETLEYVRGRVTLHLTGDATVHHASYESMSGHVIETTQHELLNVYYK